MDLADFLGFGLNHYDKTSVSQGYSIILNDMHGKPKSEKYFKHGNSSMPLSSTVFEYKNNTKLPLINEKNQIEEKEIGIQTDFFTDVRFQESKTYSGSVTPGGGLDVTTTIPIAWFTIMAMFNSDEKSVRMASTNKVTTKSYAQYKTTVYTDGAVVTTENLLWDEKTGQVVLSKMNNEFKDKTIYKLNIPAYWNYKNLGHIYPTADIKLNMNLHTNTTSTDDLSMNKSTGQVINTAKYLSDGDEVYIEDISNASIPISIGKFHYLSSIKESSSGSLMDFFVDVMGKALVPPNSSSTKYKVTLLRSANQNQQTAPGVNLVSTTNPISGSNLNMVQTGVLNGFATEYSDKWRWIAKNDQVLDANGNPKTTFIKNPVVHGVKFDWKPVRSYNLLGNKIGFTNPNEAPNLANDAIMRDNPHVGGSGIGAQIPYNFNGGITPVSWNNQSQATLFDAKGNIVEDIVKVSNMPEFAYFLNLNTGINSALDGVLNSTGTGIVYDLRWEHSLDKISWTSAVVCNNSSIPGTWAPNLNTSIWISENKDGNSTYAGNPSSSPIYHDHYYRLRVNLPTNFRDPGELKINLRLFADNSIKSVSLNNLPITLNGNSYNTICSTCVGSLSDPATAKLTGWKVGLNEIIVNVWDHTPSKSGLKAEFYSEKNCYDEITFSASKFGFNRTLPVIVAHNAQFKEIDFCSFEENNFDLPKNGVSSNAEDQYDGIISKLPYNTAGNINVVDGGHTGNKMMKIGYGNRMINFDLKISNENSVNNPITRLASNDISISSDRVYPMFNLKKDKTYKLNFWVRAVASGITTSLNSPNVVKVEFKHIQNGTTGKVFNNPSFVSDVIEGWRMVELLVPVEEQDLIDNNTLTIQFKSTGMTDILIDDIRFAPAEATSKCFVYDDKFLRLTSELDENHYATFYDYDESGNLIRIRKETERGIVTLKESNFSYQKIK